MISHKKLPNMRSRCEASPAAARRCSMTAAQRRAAGRRRRRGGPAACTLHRAPTSTPRVMPSWFDPAVRNAPVRRRPPPPGPLPDVGARAHPRRLTQDVRAITEGITHAVCSNERQGASGETPSFISRPIEGYGLARANGNPSARLGLLELFREVNARRRIEPVYFDKIIFSSPFRKDFSAMVRGGTMKWQLQI